MYPYQIYHTYLRKGQVDLDGAAAAGMIRKADLIDGAEYEGHCRNASKAKWRENTQRFEYLRTKFGESFVEEIEHPEDDRGFDVFVPVRKVDAER